MRHDSRWRMRTLAGLALGALGASGCEAVIGLGGYSEGPAPDGGDASTDSGKGHDVTVPTDARFHDTGGHDVAPQDGGSSDATVQDAPVCTTDGAASCSTTASCAALQASCSTAFCSEGCCVVAHREAGASCSDGGDVCDDAGVCVQCIASDHCPSRPCNVGSCAGGACAYEPLALDAACTANGGSKCDLMNNCVECLAASDCPANVCYMARCSAGACVYTPGNIGGTCGTGGAGICSDAGVCNECSCPAVPQCKVSTCPGCGTASATQGTPCNGGVNVCNDAGECVACNVPTDCPSPTTPCTIATCVNHMCGEGAANENTACSANGGRVCNTTAQCVMCTPTFLQACSGATPSCSTSGACVQCTSSTQCPGSAPYCIASGSCVQCTANGQCSGSTPYCSTSGSCVQCTSSSQCFVGQQCTGNVCMGL